MASQICIDLTASQSLYSGYRSKGRKAVLGETVLIRGLKVAEISGFDDERLRGWFHL
jgi:hypothetical protein